MILVRCPQCQTEYELENQLLPESGRYLLCSNCQETWFQKPEQPLVLMASSRKRSNVLPLDLSKRPEKANTPATEDGFVDRLNAIEAILHDMENSGVIPAEIVTVEEPLENVAAEAVAVEKPVAEVNSAPEAVEAPKKVVRAPAPPIETETQKDKAKAPLQDAPVDQSQIDNPEAVGVEAIYFEEFEDEKDLSDPEPEQIVISSEVFDTKDLRERAAGNDKDVEKPSEVATDKGGESSTIAEDAPGSKVETDVAQQVEDEKPVEPEFAEGEEVELDEDEANLTRRQRRQLRATRLREREEAIAAEEATKKEEEAKRANQAKEINAASATSKSDAQIELPSEEPTTEVDPLAFPVDEPDVEPTTSVDQHDPQEDESAELVVRQAVERLSESIPNRPKTVEKSQFEIDPKNQAVREFVAVEIEEPSGTKTPETTEQVSAVSKPAKLGAQSREPRPTIESEVAAKAKAMEKASRKPVEALKSDPKLAAIPKRVDGNRRVRQKIEKTQTNELREEQGGRHLATHLAAEESSKNSGFWTGFFYTACFFAIVISVRYLSEPIIELLPVSEPWLEGYNRIYDNSLGQINQLIDRI